MVSGRDVPARRRALRADVGRLAAELGRAVVEAETLNLPVEPGIRAGRDALVRWAVLLEDVIPQPASNGNRRSPAAPSCGGAAWRTRGLWPTGRVSSAQCRSSRTSLPPRRSAPTTAAPTP
jgi:hypothetical protein